MNTPKLLTAGINENVKFGKNVKVVQPVNIYNAEIGDDSFIGPFVEIQNEVIIGKRTKIQSHAFISAMVTIGDDCFIGHGAMFINDKFTKDGPARGDASKYKYTIIGNNVSIGTNATILPVKICDNVVIGAGAVVTKNIAQPGIYIGNPAKLLKS